MKDSYISGKEYNEKKEIVEIVERDIANETMYSKDKFEYIMLNICTYSKYEEENEEEEDINITMYRAKYLINKRRRGKKNNEYIMVSIEKMYNDDIECYMQTVEMSKEDIEKWY